jgi:hypothetical protein
MRNEYNEVFLGYQLGLVVKFCRNQRFEDHVGLGAFAASELDKVFSGYQPR